MIKVYHSVSDLLAPKLCAIIILNLGNITSLNGLLIMLFHFSLLTRFKIDHGNTNVFLLIVIVIITSEETVSNVLMSMVMPAKRGT